MRAILLILLFVGALLVVDGIYEQRLQGFKDNVRVEYRFIPRTYYEEQLYHSDLDLKMKDMFQKDAPYFERETVDVPSQPALNL